MSAPILMLSAASRGLTAKLMPGTRYVVGRAQESDVVVEDITLARSHFELTVVNDTWTIRDLDSPSGTYLNEALVRAPTPIRSGDEIRAGGTAFRVDGDDA